MRKSRGFTLVELMIVIAVIAILATLVLTGFRTAQASARDTQRQQNVKGIQVALECYYSANGEYPSSLNWNASGEPTKLGDCWTGGGLDQNPPGDDVDTSGNIIRSSGKCATTGTCSYGYNGGGDSYTITLTGETKTLTFSSPG